MLYSPQHKLFWYEASSGFIWYVRLRNARYKNIELPYMGWFFDGQKPSMGVIRRWEDICEICTTFREISLNGSQCDFHCVFLKDHAIRNTRLWFMYVWSFVKTHFLRWHVLANTLLTNCSSQPSLVHWLSSSIFPCLFVCPSFRPSRYGNIRPNLQFCQYIQE